MPPVCTCGTTLPENARFCFRCGKPQWEEIAVEPVPAVLQQPVLAEPEAPGPEQSKRVAFGNPIALRTSLLVASITTLLVMVPFVGFFAPLIGGFGSVALFRKRTGRVLSLQEGAKLGWITAVMNAILLTIFSSLTIAFAGSADFEAVREQLRKQAVSAAQLQVMNAPWFMGVVVLFAWLALFTISSLLHIAGGALGTMSRQKTT